MNLIHKGKANPRVKIKCLVLVKMYGNNPKKLLSIIKKKREIKIKVLPFAEFLSKILNSLWRVNEILIHKKFQREGINQYIEGIKRIPKIVLSQLSDRSLEEGSNLLNRLVIIFS